MGGRAVIISVQGAKNVIQASQKGCAASVCTHQLGCAEGEGVHVFAGSGVHCTALGQRGALGLSLC